MQGDTDTANAYLNAANSALKDIQQRLEFQAAQKRIQRRRQEVAAREQRQKAAQAALDQELDEAAAADEESLGKLRAGVESAQFSHQPASSISTFGLENNHSNPDLDRLERQVDSAKFSHEPASAIHP